MKKIIIALLVLGFAGGLAAMPGHAHAQTSSYMANITVDGSNDVLVNGQATNSDYVANDDTVNVTFNNNSGTNVLLCAKGYSPQSITNGGSGSLSVTVNGEAEIDVVMSSGNCQNGSGNPGSLFIEGATGSLSCAISSNKVWTISGQYSHVPQSMYLYRGGTYVANVPASTGGGGYYFAASVNEQFSAQASSATYYLYDGTSNGDELIGQAACPATTASKTTTTTTTSGNTTSTPNSPASSTPAATTTTSTPSAAHSTMTPLTYGAKQGTTKNTKGAKTAWYVSGGALLVLIAVILVLQFMNIWTAPKKLLLRLWSLLKALFHKHPA